MAPPFTQKATKAQEQQIKASQARTSKDAIEKALDTARGRKEFFSNRPNVSDDRALRRMKQADETQRFKNLYTKPVNIVDSEGNVTGVVSGLTQATADAPRSLTEERQRLANLYGPTPSEVFGDIGYGLGQLGKAYGIPIVSSIMRGVNAVKSGVEAAWDAVRGEPSQQTFPEFTGESENYFNNIDTGIAAGDPDNLLVQIAKENEGRFDNNQTFEERLANATAMNLNVPSIGDILVKTNDALNQAKAGVNIATPLGVVNVNPLAERVFLSGGAGNIGYGGYFNPNTSDYNLGISTALPGDFRLSAGTSSNDLPGVSLSNTYLPKIFGTDIRGMGNVVPSVNMSGQGDLSLGVNTTVDPLKMFGVESAIPFNIGVGAKVNQQGGFSPNLNFNVPFNSSGLGYMFK
jgi:hypothetical protein